MYVIFKDDSSVILSDQGEFSTVGSEFLKQGEGLAWSEEHLDRILDSLKRNEGKSFLLYGQDSKEMWSAFCSRFKIIEAAGGIVKNEKDECLFIYRNDTWDLPKGKIDPGETFEQAALREVEEECGISDLQLGSRIQNTYHIYEHKEKQILKITYWYLMNSRQNILTPQVEEGITELGWKTAADRDEILDNTYPNIKMLLTEQGLLGL